MAKKAVKKKSTKKKTPTPKHPVKVIKKTVTTTTTTTPHKIGEKTKAKPKKKVVRKKTVKRRSAVRKPKMPRSDLKLERVLIENFVSLQRVMVNLSVKFDNLANKLSKLLELFEISAKALAEKDFTLEKTNRNDEQIIKKIDNLSEQNKVIARGLTLLHEPRSSQQPMQMLPPSQQPMRMPPAQSPIQQPATSQIQSQDTGRYQRSISSKPREFKQLPKQKDVKTNF